MKIKTRLQKTFRRFGYRVARYKERRVAKKARPRIFFIHTPKTGGNSINSYFKEYVGSKRSGRVTRYDDFGPRNIDAFVTHARSAKFVTGHMPWTAFERCRDENTFAFVILRDPYDRLRSLYHYIVNLPASYERADEINDMQHMSLTEFLSSQDRRVRFYTDNYLARQLAGSLDVFGETPEERERLVEMAINNLSSLDLIGFNDQLDVAFGDAALVAGLPPPPSGYRLNVTADLVKAPSKRSDATRPLSPEMRELARPLVEADMAIYQHFLELRRLDPQANGERAGALRLRKFYEVVGGVILLSTYASETLAKMTDTSFLS